MIERNVIPIVFAVDAKFEGSMAVALESLALNASQHTFYQVTVITEKNTELLRLIKKDLETRHSNLKINICCISLHNDISKRFWTNSGISRAAYFRLFIEDVLSDIGKCIYLDSDVIILSDLSKLFQVDLNDNIIGAVKNAGMEKEYKINKKYKEYIDNVLCIPVHNFYFNSGVLLIDLNKWKEFGVKEKAIKELLQIEYLFAHDQDLLNKVLVNRSYQLDCSWNYQWTWMVSEDKDINLDDANIIHYVTGIKPWTYDTSDISPKEYSDSPSLLPWIVKLKYCSDIWWKYAKGTICYEKLATDYLRKKKSIREFLRHL